MQANNQVIASNNKRNNTIVSMDKELESMLETANQVKKTEQSILEDEERKIVAFDPDKATATEKIEFNKMKFLHYKPFWWRNLQLKWNKTGTVGTIMATVLQNAVVIIENDDNTIDSFAFNEFTREHISKRDVDLRGHIFDSGYVSNMMISAIRTYMEVNYRVSFSEKMIAPAIDLVGYYNKFNPVSDYMKLAHEKWIDAGKPKLLDNFFVDSLGVEKNELTTLKTRIFFAEMVTKGMHPETSADFVLDLVGGQGSGKTRTLRRLGLNWYTEDVPNFYDKDQIIKMASSLLVNDDEMKATKASGLEQTKSFITSVKQTYRVPYGVKAETVTKNCVLSRTTNNAEYLNDITGDRRFMPMMCVKGNKTKDISDYSDDEIAMLFGEAFELVESGFDYNRLTAEQSMMLEDSREEFTLISEEESVLDRYLSTFDGEFVTMGELMEAAFGIKAGDSTSGKLQSKISSVMSSKYDDWHKARRRIDGSQYRGWERVNK